MKRVLASILALLLLLGTAVAEQTEAEPLSAQELNTWTESLVQRAIQDKLEVKETPEGLTADGRGYSLYPNSADLSPDTLLSGAVIDSESIEVSGLTGPRTLIVTQAVGAVLEAFPNDNPSLQGNEDAAVLYVRGALPETVQTGTLMRKGQQITLLEYSVYTPHGEGVDRSGVQFTVDQGSVTAIRYFGGEDVPLAEAETVLQSLSELQEENSYFAFSTVNPGPMHREDLVFSGLDFVDMTMEDAIAHLGEPESREKVEDSTGDTIETLQWPGLNITFILGANGNFLRTDSVVIYGDVEGPRGTRPGEDMLDIIARFENKAESINTPSVSLYGSADKPEEAYGQLMQDAGAQHLYYSVPLKDGVVLFACHFMGEQLVEMSLSHM